jgi:hypothetical protein
MAVYIDNGEKEMVVVDPKSDEQAVIERISTIPGMTARKATEEEVKRLWKPNEAAVFGQTKPTPFI